MEKLTNKQQRIYDYIKKYIEENNIPPTIREICGCTGLTSTSTVHTHLSNLEKKGYITRKKSKNRYMEITEKGFYENKYKTLPVISGIKRGTGLLDDENIEDYFPVPDKYLKGEDNFILRVKENGMINSGIRENDLVIVKRQSFAENRDIAAAFINGYIVCRRFFKEDNEFLLVPDNDKYLPVRYEKLIILGKITGVFRNF